MIMKFQLSHIKKIHIIFSAVENIYKMQSHRDKLSDHTTQETSQLKIFSFGKFEVTGPEILLIKGKCSDQKKIQEK